MIDMTKADTLIQTVSGEWIRFGDITSFQPTTGAAIVWTKGADRPVFVTREAIAAAGLRQGC